MVLPVHGQVLEGFTQQGDRPLARVDFDAMYREHFGFVWRTLRRLGVHVDSLDDAAQEVFLVVHRRASELRSEGSPKAWLFAIAQRVASDHRRWRRRKGNLLPLDGEVPGRTQTPLEHAMDREASSLVLDFLAQLDEPRRAAFLLADLEQMTAPEIARATGANINTVYYRIASARKAFVAFVLARHPDGLEDGHGG
jgi:RNA polymerase sigma-70 factor (ECF subfamily)